MAILTKYKTFTFVSTVEEFTASIGNDTTATRNSIDSCLEMSITGENKINSSNNTGSFEEYVITDSAPTYIEPSMTFMLWYSDC